MNQRLTKAPSQKNRGRGHLWAIPEQFVANNNKNGNKNAKANGPTHKNKHHNNNKNYLKT